MNPFDNGCAYAPHTRPTFAWLLALFLIGCSSETLDVGDLPDASVAQSGSGVTAGGRTEAGDASGGSSETAGAGDSESTGSGGAESLGGPDAGSETTGGAAGGPDAGSETAGGGTAPAGGRDAGSETASGGAAPTGGRDAGSETTSGGAAPTGGGGTSGGMGGATTTNSGGTRVAGGQGGAGGGPPESCDSTLEYVDMYEDGAMDVCTFDLVCDQLGCGTLGGALDRCGNQRTECSTNGDCPSGEVCTPLTAFNAGTSACGFPYCVLNDGECVCGPTACGSFGAWCTPVQNVPEPCTEEPTTQIAEQMVLTLGRTVPSQVAPELLDPQLQCLERYRDHLAPGTRFCQFLCGPLQPADCESWCGPDPEAVYHEIVSLLLDSEQPLDTTPLEVAMQRL